MRKIAVICMILIFVLSVVPLCIKGNTDLLPDTMESSRDESSINIDENEEDVVALALEIADESFCDEGLKAMLALAGNNLTFSDNHKSSADIQDNEDLYKKLKELYKDSEAEILYNNERVYIPLSELTNGATAENEKYPYIIRVASPWDLTDEEFVYGKEYAAGISLKGINYLCKSGYTYKDALRWYLPEFDIK